MRRRLVEPLEAVATVSSNPPPMLEEMSPYGPDEEDAADEDNEEYGHLDGGIYSQLSTVCPHSDNDVLIRTT